MKQDVLAQITAINLALRGVSTLYVKWSNKHNINHFTMKILYILITEGSVTQKKIGEDNKLPKQTVNNIVTALKKDGYVTLVSCEKDKREKLIVLTESGREYVANLLESLFQIEEKTIEKMGTQNVLKLIELVTIYGNIMEQEMQNKEAVENK